MKEWGMRYVLFIYLGIDFVVFFFGYFLQFKRRKETTFVINIVQEKSDFDVN